MNNSSRSKKHKPTPKNLVVATPVPAEPNRLNVYKCNRCGQETVTIDRHKGVTPFMIGCTKDGGCEGDAYSSFYRVNPTLEPTYEWYYPESLKSVSSWEMDHVKQGGLLFREIQKQP